MATKSTALRTAQADAFATLVNGGSLEVLHSDGSTVLVSQPVGASAFSATNAVASGSTTQADASHGLADGVAVATTARFKDSSDAVVLSGLSVSTGGADLNLDNTAINDGQTVEAISFTYTVSEATA